MKKLVLSSYTKYPNESVGGPNKIIYQLIKNLNTDKFNIEFISSDYHLKSIEIKELIKKEYRFKPIKLFAEYLYNNVSLVRNLFSSSLYLKKHFERKDDLWKSINISGDILHSHDSRSLYHLQKNFQKKILTIHSKGRINEDMLDAFPRFNKYSSLLRRLIEIEKEALAHADKIIFPSFSARDLFFKGFDIVNYQNKTVIIYNGVDVDYIKRIKVKNDHSNLIDKKKKMFLSVASFTKLKRIDLIIKSIANLREKNFPVKLVLVGEGPLETQLKELAKKMKISNEIIFMKPQNNIDILSLMKCSDAFIMASEKVIFDMVILEALACGCRVIANDEGGNKEIIKDGDNGYLVGLKSSEDLTQKILSIDFDQKLELSETHKKIDVANMITQHLSLYES